MRGARHVWCTARLVHGTLGQRTFGSAHVWCTARLVFSAHLVHGTLDARNVWRSGTHGAAARVVQRVWCKARLVHTFGAGPASVHDSFGARHVWCNARFRPGTSDPRHVCCKARLAQRHFWFMARVVLGTLGARHSWAWHVCFWCSGTVGAPEASMLRTSCPRADKCLWPPLCSSMDKRHSSSAGAPIAPAGRLAWWS